ncbi:MAG: hypothetical protein ACPGXK_11505 [Phycisphaerae bacterium]
MQIRFHCPKETCVALIEYEPLTACEGEIVCPRCSVPIEIKISDSIREDDMVDACPICNSRELFIRKDFPQVLGLMVVVVFGLISIYFFSTSLLLAWGVLASAVLIDLVIYAFVGKVTTCYACRAEFRKGKLNPAHELFDLATSEKY